MIRTQTTQCTVCGRKDFREQFRALDRLHGTEGTYTYVECANCRHLYVNPSVDTRDIAKIYPSDYSPHLVAPTIGRETSGAKGWRERFLDSLRYLLVFRLLYCFKGMRLSSAIYRRLDANSRVLDVGCGSGSYLNMLRMETGAMVSGIDISENAVTSARNRYGIEVFQGSIEESHFQAKFFDLIVAWWYLEHVPDPRVALKKITDLLKPDGVFVVGVPNARSLNRFVFRGLWYHLDTPRHYNLWTKDSLKRMAADFDLICIDEKCDRTPWGLLGSLQYLVFGDNHTPWKKNLIRGNPILTLMLLPFTWALSFLGLSDIMVMHFKKKPSIPG